MESLHIMCLPVEKDKKKEKPKSTHNLGSWAHKSCGHLRCWKCFFIPTEVYSIITTTTTMQTGSNFQFLRTKKVSNMDPKKSLNHF